MTEREIIAKEWHDDNGILHRREVGQELVRCKECKHWTKWSDGEMFCGCLDGGIGSDADDFCSYGVMKNETN